MDQGNGFQFVVDEQYENEKGVFTVLSIHKNDMVIRWESGEELRTDIELQRNIQARREWEEMEKEKAAQAAKSGRKSGAAKAAAVFEGLKDTDFKKSASGTKWRGRNQLGGAVTHKLSDRTLNFNSWAFANKPEMHWLDTGHHKKRSGETRAKMFVRVNADAMFLGFSLGKTQDDAEASKNWDAFMSWLEDADNQETLHSIALNNELTIYDKYRPDSPMLVPSKKGWQVDTQKKKKTASKLNDFIESLSAEGSVSLEIAKTLKKEASLTSGKEIAVEIAELFTQLFPLYRAAWV